MTKIRKQKRRKQYRYNVNRKRLNKNVKKAWKERFSCRQNLKSMGLVYDVNKEIGVAEECKMDVDAGERTKPKAKVAEELEKDANTLREKGYRLPKNQVEYLSYLLDKYGEDYKAMARDKRNIIQATWKQIRSKINVFKSIPEQFNEYLQQKNNKV
ncbi:UNVERIFIED_CONTAM: hypothetical protein PYX00_002590 [Menopon gallinae]|uniref:Nucleolar protein 16 n=1 Tax=Menopon gallinae TaxID=328185 RepID=A0AAW2IIP1_9NEOP